MVAAPSAVAADGAKAKAAKVSKKAGGAKSAQNGRKLPAANPQRLRRRIVNAEESLRGTGTAIRTLLALSRSNKDGLAFLSAAAPQLINGLVTLRDGVLQLKSVLETQVQPALVRVRDEVVPGLQRLGSAYQSVEYGRAGIFASGPATPASTIAGQFLTTADIPDDGNTITANESAFVIAQAPGTMVIDLRAAIRSAESDGDSASETAGQAGGFVFVREGLDGDRVACAGAPNPPGIMGTQAGETIQTPSGPTTSLSLKNIPGGFSRTDQTAPTSSSTSLLPAPCTFTAAPGEVYEVQYSVNFVDIPTSTNPGPTE